MSAATTHIRVYILLPLLLLGEGTVVYTIMAAVFTLYAEMSGSAAGKNW